MGLTQVAAARMVMAMKRSNLPAVLIYAVLLISLNDAFHHGQDVLKCYPICKSLWGFRPNVVFKVRCASVPALAVSCMDRTLMQ